MIRRGLCFVMRTYDDANILGKYEFTLGYHQRFRGLPPCLVLRLPWVELEVKLGKYKAKRRLIK